MGNMRDVFAMVAIGHTLEAGVGAESISAKQESPLERGRAPHAPRAAARICIEKHEESGRDLAQKVRQVHGMISFLCRASRAFVMIVR
jgi:hypothetical protein